MNAEAPSLQSLTAARGELLKARDAAQANYQRASEAFAADLSNPELKAAANAANERIGAFQVELDAMEIAMQAAQGREAVAQREQAAADDDREAAALVELVGEAQQVLALYFHTAAELNTVQNALSRCLEQLTYRAGHFGRHPDRPDRPAAVGLHFQTDWLNEAMRGNDELFAGITTGLINSRSRIERWAQEKRDRHGREHAEAGGA